MQCGRGCGPWGRACPFPLPAASSLPRGWAFPKPATSSLDLLGPFILQMAGSVFGWLIFSLSPAIPQFKLVTHKSCLQLSSVPGPYRPLLSFPPPLAGGGYAGVWGTFLLGVAFRHQICGFYLLFPSQSGCPQRFKNLPQTRQCKGFLVFGNFLY